MNKFKILIILTLISFILNACGNDKNITSRSSPRTQEEGREKVNDEDLLEITIQDGGGISSLINAEPGLPYHLERFNKYWTGSLPHSIDEINCFMVFVSQGDLDHEIECNASNGMGVFLANQYYGAFPNNRLMLTDLEAGKRYRLFIIGIKVSNQSLCRNIQDWGQGYGSEMGIPVVVGAQSIDMNRGVNRIDINTSLEEAIFVNSCEYSQ